MALRGRFGPDQSVLELLIKGPPVPPPEKPRLFNPLELLMPGAGLAMGPLRAFKMMRFGQAMGEGGVLPQILKGGRGEYQLAKEMLSKLPKTSLSNVGRSQSFYGGRQAGQEMTFLRNLAKSASSRRYRQLLRELSQLPIRAN